MLTATKVQPISAEQYTALLQPVRPPPPQELFEFQRAKLADKKLAPVEMFDHFASRLPAHGLFLLVPPQPGSPDTLDWNDLMARVELDGKKGRNYLTPKHLKDTIEVPKVPTMLVGVEDGRGRLNTKPSVSREAIKKEGCTAYHTWRGYTHLVLFPMVLKHHNMDIVGSLFKAEFVPFFCLLGDEPTISYRWLDNAHPQWGAPSCGGIAH